MFAAGGGHWLALQSVAWSGMLVHYSREASLVVAVEKTFSGRNPCEMCKGIEEEKKKEQRAPQVAAGKLELFHVTEHAWVWPAAAPHTWGDADVQVAGTRVEQPAVPPPRFA